MKKWKPIWLGLAQSAGLTAYILLFVSFVQGVGRFVPEDNNPWFMIFPLMAFVTSALICGSIALINPIMLFLDGERKRALYVIFWTALWLIALSSIVIWIAL